MSDEKEVPTVSNRRRVLQAAGLVSAAVLVSRMLGLVREIVVRTRLGIGTLPAEAYEIAARVPEAIFLIIAGGAIGSAFIPTFAVYFEEDDEAGGWRLFSAVINLVTVTVTVVAAVSMLFAPQLVLLLADQKVAANPSLLPLTVALMRVMLLSTIIFGASGVIMGALNARQHFLLPAIAPSIYTLGIIGGGLLWPAGGRYGPEMGLAVGAVAGAAGHLLVQLPGLRWKGGRYTAVLTLRDRGVRQVLKLMSPRVLGLSFSELNKIITTILTDTMITGSLPALNTAFRLIIMPQGIIGQALGIAAFPTLASLAARRAYDEMRRILSDSLRILLFLGLPAAVMFVFLGDPIVTILFERGQITGEDTRLVVWALGFYALGLVPLIALEVIARTFYALNDTLTPVLAGGVQIGIMYAFSIWFSRFLFPAQGWLPLGGLALGFSLSNLLEVLVLLELLRRRMGGIDGGALLRGGWRMGAAALLMAGAMWGVAVRGANWSVWLQLIAGAAAGGLVYLGSCYALQLRELRTFIGAAMAALSRRRGRG